MKRIRFVPATLTCLWLVVLCVSCTANKMTEPSPTATATPTESMEANEELTDTIGSILTGGGWEGQEVTLVGYYRGWDLLQESGQSPPVTRSDWVITDSSGAIYVQMNDVEIEGTEKLASEDRLVPHLKEATSHIIRVTGIVRVTAKGQRYIEPTRMELVK